MKIYLSHSAKYNYTDELYLPLKQTLAKTHAVFFPHDDRKESVKTKDVIAGSDVVLAEVSRPATGQGIELGWADAAGVPIVCFYETGAKIAGSLRFISSEFIEYGSQEEMVSGLKKRFPLEKHNS